MAWALLVVIGKYQVVEDLKGSNEGEKVPRFFYVQFRAKARKIVIDNIKTKQKMNNEFKKIAKQLGIAIPACLLSIGVANAETVKENEMSKSINSAVSEISKSNIVNNEVVKFLTTNCIKNVDRMSPDHSDFHTNQGGNHANHHSNKNHSDNHTNRAAVQSLSTNQCVPHSDTHSNRDGYNQHTNTGNNNHQDYHTNRDYKTNC